jgi:hypothetical protein
MTPVEQLARVHAALTDPDLRRHIVAVSTGGGKAAKRCVTAVTGAAGLTARATKDGCDAAVSRLRIAAKDFDAVLKHRGDQPHAEAVADAGVDALKALRAIDWKARPPQPIKGTLAFTRDVGTVLRDPTSETTVVMEVAREGVSTDEAASIPAVAVELPPDILKAVGPAEFGAGQRLGHVPVVLRPYGTGVAATARRTPGKARIVPSELFDPGAAATQDFVVQDGQDVVWADNIFVLPEVKIDPLKFLLGMSMGYKLADKATWIKAFGRKPLCGSGGSHASGRTATWTAVRGGERGVIGNQTQLEAGGHATNMDDALDIVEPGSGQLFVATWRTVPDGIKEGDYADLVNGAHDNDAYIMGWNAWVLMKSRGYTGGQLVVRGDKEYNGGGYGVTAANAALRAGWLARFILNFNKGYLDAGADTRPRHVLGLARHDYLGPLEAHVPVGPNGQVLIDGVREWVRGGFEHGRDCYAPDHSDPTRSGLVVAKAHGIRISNFETSPRDDAHACQVSAAAWQALFDFWTEHADVVGGVGIYHNTCLNRNLQVGGAPVPGWADGVDALVRLATGG